MGIGAREASSVAKNGGESGLAACSTEGDSGSGGASPEEIGDRRGDAGRVANRENGTTRMFREMQQEAAGTALLTSSCRGWDTTDLGGRAPAPGQSGGRSLRGHARAEEGGPVWVWPSWSYDAQVCGVSCGNHVRSYPGSCSSVSSFFLSASPSVASACLRVRLIHLDFAFFRV